MAIHRWGTFDYLVILPAQPWERPGPWIAVDPALQKLVAQNDPREEKRLVGPRPMLEVDGGVLTLVAPTMERAQLQSFRLEVDPELIAALRPRDTLHLRRTACGGLGLSVIRGRRLIVAVGAVTSVPLASVEAVRLGSAIAACVEEHKAILEAGESARLGDYVIRSEHGFIPGIPGTDEVVSIALVDAIDPAAAERSARLMGAGVLGTDWRPPGAAPVTDQELDD